MLGRGRLAGGVRRGNEKGIHVNVGADLARVARADLAAAAVLAA